MGFCDCFLNSSELAAASGVFSVATEVPSGPIGVSFSCAIKGKANGIKKTIAQRPNLSALTHFIDIFPLFSISVLLIALSRCHRASNSCRWRLRSGCRAGGREIPFAGKGREPVALFCFLSVQVFNAVASEDSVSYERALIDRFSSVRSSITSTVTPFSFFVGPLPVIHDRRPFRIDAGRGPAHVVQSDAPITLIDSRRRMRCRLLSE